MNRHSPSACSFRPPTICFPTRLLSVGTAAFQSRRLLRLSESQSFRCALQNTPPLCTMYAGSSSQVSLRAAQRNSRIAVPPKLSPPCHCCRHTHVLHLRLPRMQPQARSTGTPPLATVQLQSAEAPTKAAPAEPELAAHLCSLLPVRLHDSTLSVQGHNLISGLSTQAFRSPDVRAQEQQGVLLGLAGDSSAALRDFKLGQVGCHWCCNRAHPALILVPERQVSLPPCAAAQMPAIPVVSPHQVVVADA